MSVGRILVRLIVAFTLGSMATWLLFAVLTLIVEGRLVAGSVHSGLAAVLLIQPIAWAVAFWRLSRAGFPGGA